MVTISHIPASGTGVSTSPASGCGETPVVGASWVIVADVGCYVAYEQPLGEALVDLGLMCAAQLRRLSRTRGGGGLIGRGNPTSFLFDLHKFGIPHAIAASYCLTADPREDLSEGKPSTMQGGEAKRPDLVAARASLHARLGLPTDRPLLRSSCALSFDTLGKGVGRCAQTRLKNAHRFIPGSLLPGDRFDRCVVVRGDYEYYHYLQDGIDDKGWGCAYRSLQTILSWFRLNNYTTVPMPMHRQIQEILVAAKDKPESFVGSRTWIGGTEIARVLESLLPDVTCRMIRTATGPAIADHARTLQEHFATEGTPVMIGGGALAFTLLGVAFNAATGASRFLILDPHYCGDEVVQTITSKVVPLMGYKGIPCEWRAATTFKDGSYSLCLPLRPNPTY